MNAYLVTVKEPKKQEGKFHVTRGVVIAESMEEGLKTVKERYYTNGARGWHPDASFNIISVEPGFYPM